MVPFGSFVIGLATKSSDIDLNIQLQNSNSSAVAYVLQEGKKLFMKQPDLYSDVNIIGKPYFPHLDVFHISSQRSVDLTFPSEHDYAVCNSQLHKYYFNLNEKNLALGLFLKYWFKYHGFIESASVKLESYGLYLMIIFYLQQKKLAPPGYVLQLDAKRNFIGNWNVGFNELPYPSENTETLHQLVGGFFKYYSEFNFEEYIVSPFTGRPIPRNAFIDIDKFPMEYTLYESTLKHELQIRIKENLNVSSPVCIQSVFQHDQNAAERLSPENAMEYKSLYKSVAKLFKDLPSDSILKIILVKDQFKETISNQTNFNVGGINEKDCIEVKTGQK